MPQHEIQQYWKEILDTMNDGLMVIGADGTILMVNQALEQLTGYNRDELIGVSCSIFNSETCEQARKDGKTKWCILFYKGHLHARRCLVVRKDGSYVPVVKNASLLKDAAGKILGAVETFTDITELHKREECIARLSRLLEDDADFHGIVGRSDPIMHMCDIIEKAAQSDAPVIILGESGSGKELVAQALHDLGKRKNGPFIRLNCAALNASLLESELFGHRKGAFTGAYENRRGRFEAADGGDIFLDEIGDLPISIQVKLLRVLENRQFERVGDHRSISVDVRIITATNRNLEELVAQGTFRQDLYFRINVIPIVVPPLRDRLEDIPLLVRHSVDRLAQKSGKKIHGLTPGAMERFMNYHWPGNVREMKSALEYAFVIADEGLIESWHLPDQLSGQKEFPKESSKSTDAQKKRDLIEALRKAGGNQTQAARLLNINRVTVWNRMRKYGIDVKRIIKS